MTNATLTLDEGLAQLRPYLSEDFLKTWRQVGHTLGYRVIGRALAALAIPGPTAMQVIDAETRWQLRDDMDNMREWLEANPVLRFQRLRQVSRIRSGAYGHKSNRPRPYLIEQVSVSEHLADLLKRRGVKVEHARNGTYWADAEDEAWGADSWLTECYGQREMPDTAAMDLLRRANLYTESVAEIERKLR